MEKFALIMFLPFFFDVAMFIRFRFIDKAGDVEAFGKVSRDGSLTMPYEKIYDFTHLIIAVLGRFKKKVYERDVVIGVYAVEIALALVALLFWTPV